ncbi:hypothetical protein [Halorarius halobius]|uniref:hypothetical protein n=1 Tax=Halorarius halobius TaxID=2962671 RepID=UPI0020CC1F98|nr:hypothetical protein [Halorarius halobius]
MTDTDEHLLTAAKLREAARGRIEGADHLLDVTGMVADEQDMSSLAFMSGIEFDADDVPLSFQQSALGSAVVPTLASEEAARRIFDGDSHAVANYIGVTEQDLDASALRLPMQLLDAMDNHDAPAFVLAAGNPNTGKTNTMSLLVELRRLDRDDLLVVSNVREWDETDELVTSAHDLAVTLLEHRETPKFVVIDEASTHFDARTNSREVATQWTPLAKRFAKIGVDVCGLIAHTGKDVHPEAKALATLPFYKVDQKTADFYSYWPRDEDFPVDQRFGGSLENLEPTAAWYDPDDAAPWSWDLQPELFSDDLDWPDLLDELRRQGPAED